MHQDELRREAKLIVQSRQVWVSDFASFWSRLVAKFGIAATKSADKELRLH